MKKILVTLPYSYNYRNFVGSGFLLKAAKDFDISIFIDINIKIDPLIDHSNLNIIRCNFDQNILVRSIYKLLKESIFFSQETSTQKIKFHQKSFLWRLYLNFFGSNLFLMKFYKFLYERLLKNSDIQLKIKNFDFIIFTMGHKPYESKFFVNKSKKTTTFNIIHSWDVITTKGAFLFDYDYTVTWNEVTKNEYIHLIQKNNNFNGIVIANAPIHFDIYNSIKDKKGKYILYSTSVERLVPNEIEIIKSILDFCKIEGIPLKIRNHPQRIKNINIEGGKLILTENNPIKPSRDNATFDSNFFSNLSYEIKESKLVICIVSTIAIDALCLNRNVIFLNFNNFSKSIRNYYEYEHVEKFIKICSVPVATDIKEMKVFIKSLSSESNYRKQSIYPFMQIKSPQEKLLRLLTDIPKSY
jgi:hypothetical protein